MGNRSTKSTLRNAIVLLNISADEIKLDDDKFWSQIWNEDPQVGADIIRAISLQEIRMLRDGSPKNFASLTYKMVELIYLATGTLCNTHSQQTAVIIATKILTRIIPCMFEDIHWKNFFIDNKIEKNFVDLKYPKEQQKKRNYEAYLPHRNIDKSFICQQSIPRTSNNEDCNDDDEEDVDEEDSSQICNKDGQKTKSPDLVSLDPESNEQTTSQSSESTNDQQIPKDSLLNTLVMSICDLLFCPEFTVLSRNDNHLISNVIDAPPVDLKSLQSCEYVWEPGVGFDSKTNSTTYYDKSRAVLLKLLLTIQSEILYVQPKNCNNYRNLWIERIVNSDNRHVLPIFTTLLNTVFTHNPTKSNLFNRILFEDNRTEVVELCIQILISTLDHQFTNVHQTSQLKEPNLFIEYLSRIHRSEDYEFIIKGFVRLLNSCLEQNYLMSSPRNVNFHQELLILFWRLSNVNEKFVGHLLKSNSVLDIVVPILYHLNENFQDTTKTALIHLGVFNLLILSGERNFGVKLNKSYSANVLMNLPTFTGSHADLLIIVFHKLILYGLGLNQLFDYMLTILVNISPYLKALSVLACKCLIQLFEIFSSPMIMFTEPKYHKMVLFLLEIFNNLIQYQFDGNTNLVYVIIKHKQAFTNLSILPCTKHHIDKILSKIIKKRRKMIDSIGQNSDNNNNDQMIHDKKNNNSEGDLLATISIDSLETSKSSTVNRGVSLTPTPNISRVTEQIRPSYESKSRTETPIDRPSICFDDILNEESKVNNNSESSLNHNLMNVFFSSDDDCDDAFPEQINSRTNDQPKKPRLQEPDRWRPTPEWLRDWKRTLPLQTILRMIEVLVPQVEQLKEDCTSQDEIELMKFLQNGTLVGLLPVPHPIIIRKYRTNNAASIWFKTCSWGIIYVRQDIWTDTSIKLIKAV